METINQKLNYKREISSYNFAWNLASDSNRQNLIFDYSKRTKQNLLPSGRMLCKTGCFQGPGKYFEFFTLIQGDKMQIFLKMNNPSKEQMETCGETFEISSASLYTNTYLNRCNHARFCPSYAPPGFADADDVSSKSAVKWMSATFLAFPPVPSKSVTCLNIAVTVHHDKCLLKKEYCQKISAIGKNMFEIDVTGGGNCVSTCAKHNNHGHVSSIIRGTANLDTSLHLFSQNFSDCYLKCGDQEYPAHQIILANKSSVFEAMFSNPMEENLTGRVNIVDSEPEVVEELLRFICTGTVQKLKENASGIFLIADKYNVQDLKLTSENYLVDTTSVENVLEQYTLGKLLNSDTLVKNCVEKMKAEKKAIWKTDKDFYEDCQKFPELFDMVFA